MKQKNKCKCSFYCLTYQELADACNADSDDMEMKFMSILCTRSFPHLRKGRGQNGSITKIIDLQIQMHFPANVNNRVDSFHLTITDHFFLFFIFLYLWQCSRSLSDSQTKTLNRSSRRKCQEMWKMPSMQSVKDVFEFMLDYILLSIFHHWFRWQHVFCDCLSALSSSLFHYQFAAWRTSLLTLQIVCTKPWRYHS